jgi:DNA ligase-1
VCTAYSYKKGEKTGRDVLTLTVAYRGVETEVGSGIPHDLHWTDAFAKIVEIECMAVNPNNTLREPRFKGLRWDKERPDE